MRDYWVYIAASKYGVLYVGVTSDLIRRMYEHRTKAFRGFTAKYNVDRLVYFEQFVDPMNAISREKQLKSWRREKKVALIEAMNPYWRDLYDQLSS